ncbi:MAG: orotidine-5'-phosphate decarboxylase [Candidatus Micrarchaeota archaeon]|nr:orotidine-5'-phosphate decarboxylase [Candidatus Micrarchaeota archaeon]
MSYLELLSEHAERRNSILCFGIDPDLAQMPQMHADTAEEKIVKFFSDIIDAALQQEKTFSAIKPNYAYFAQYGFEGLRALYRLIQKYRGQLPIILDAKRGDIGKSSSAYAQECFSFWGADATTVSPYMGSDSIEPFLSFCKQAKGVYVLCRTSNSGAFDFQALAAEDGKELYLHVAQKIAKWYTPGIGAVVGATGLQELEKIVWVFYDAGLKVPLLIPGVGTQGGSASQTSDVLRSIWPQSMPLHRINASSSIAYAWKKAESQDYVGEALRQIESLNRQIGKITR